MKRILMALAVSSATLLAHATTPTAQSIENLLTLTQAEKILDSIKPQVFAMVKATVDKELKGRQPSIDEQKVLDEYAEKTSKIASDSITMERLKPLYIQLYTQYFTAEDIEALTVFYQTPAGQSLITKMPQLVQGLMAAMPLMMDPVAKQMEAASRQLKNDMEALRAKDPKPKS